MLIHNANTSSSEPIVKSFKENHQKNIGKYQVFCSLDMVATSFNSANGGSSQPDVKPVT